MRKFVGDFTEICWSRSLIVTQYNETQYVYRSRLCKEGEEGMEDDSDQMTTYGTHKSFTN